MPTFVTKYAKAWTALAGAAITWGVMVLQSPSGPITGGEVAGGLLLLGTALGVRQVTNAA